MCLIIIAYQCTPEFSLVLAANRDEFYDRPSSMAHVWSPRRGFYTGKGDGDGDEKPSTPILAGKDLQAGGTWLGVGGKGTFRFAAVTNYREPPADIPPDKRRSRGGLVSEFLVSDVDARDYLKAIQEHASCYEGFNLLVGDSSGLWYFSNRDVLEGAAAMRKLDPGRVYCMCNRLLDDPWPKVVRTRHDMTTLMRSIHNYSADEAKEKLFRMLRDTTKAPDQDLPKDTGMSQEIEKLFSSIFIESDWYSTRASTLVLIPSAEAAVAAESTKASPDNEGLVCSFSERSFGMYGEPLGKDTDVNETFTIDSFPS